MGRHQARPRCCCCCRRRNTSSAVTYELVQLYRIKGSSLSLRAFARKKNVLLYLILYFLQCYSIR